MGMSRPVLIEKAKRRGWRVARRLMHPQRLPYYGQLERCVDAWLTQPPGQREGVAANHFIRGGYRGFELAGGIEAGFRLVAKVEGNEIPGGVRHNWTDEKGKLATFGDVLHAYMMVLRLTVGNFQIPNDPGEPFGIREEQSR